MDISDFRNRGSSASPLFAVAGLLILFFGPLASIPLSQFLALFLFSSGLILGVKGRKSQRRGIAKTGAVFCGILLIFSVLIGVDSFKYFEYSKQTPFSGFVLPFGWDSNEIALMFQERYDNNTYGFPFVTQICPYHKDVGCQSGPGDQGTGVSSACLCRFHVIAQIMNSLSYALIVFMLAYIAVSFFEKSIVTKITGQ